MIQIRPNLFALIVTLCVFHGFSASAEAGDWPTWRYDAGRTAASPDALPKKLFLEWRFRHGPRVPVWDDPLNRDLMRYDKSFEPIVVGKTMLLAFNDSDKVVAFKTDSGERKWTFYTDGPVRFPPTVSSEKVYAVSDDGYLYCLNLADGKLLWKRRGGPSERKIIGNRRLISTWPARGAPIVDQGKVYFASSIWPFMGTFIYCLDANTGAVVWLNDGSGSTFINQPHNSPSFAGIGPQGAMVIAGDKLLVPGGRSVPAAFDLKTGRQIYYHLAANGKRGGASVFALGNTFFSHERKNNFSRFDLKTGNMIKGRQMQQPVLTAGRYYVSGETVSAVSAKDGASKIWKLDVDASGDLIKAGNRLYAGGQKQITVIAENGNAASVVQKIDVPAPILRLVAADDKLFAVTDAGEVLIFGGKAKQVAIPPVALAARKLPIAEAKRILKDSGETDGFALFYGVGDGTLLEALAQESDLHIVALDADAKKIRDLRKRLDNLGLYGKRISLHHGTPLTFQAPSYMASISIVNDLPGAGYESTARFAQAVFKPMRPYGGTTWIRCESGSGQEKIAAAFKSARLSNAKVTTLTGGVILRRVGALAGAADWTHVYGSTTNSIKSDDKLVKLPLGILWFGGSSNMDVLPRHGHGPTQQVAGGRMFIEGMDGLSARDVYTGRVLWKVKLDKLGNFGVYFDHTYKDTPLSTAYNQVHIPGTNARGTNFVVTEDRVYILQENECHVLDTKTGKTVKVIEVPAVDGEAKPKDWAYIAVYQDALIGGSGFQNFSRLGKKGSFKAYDKSASDGIIVMDRMTGEVRWKMAARHGFLHNAIAVGRDTLYCLDKLPPYVEEQLSRKGRDAPKDYRLLAIDIKSGKIKWEKNTNLFGSWLGFSKEHNLLFQTTRPSRDTISGEDGNRMIAYDATSGKVVWDKKISYSTPPILHNKWIIAGGKAFDIKTGEPIYRKHPLTGKRILWSYTRGYGCNYPVASEHMLLFRSAAAGFYDLLSDGGTGNFGGFKSSCTSNLIAAGGVLNAPDYTRTCVCSYQNQTSLAMIHMPELEMWTYNSFAYNGLAIRRVGINFGAAGDRRSEAGTLWLDYPSRGSPSPNIPVTIDNDAKYFRNHASRFSGPGIGWVGASGLTGETEISIHLLPNNNSKSSANGSGVRVAASADDAEEDTQGKVNLTSSDLELTKDKTDQIIGMRFANVKIPQGAKIASAYLQFTVDEPHKRATKLNIAGQSANNAAPFSTVKHNISSRKKTIASVAWKPVGWPREGVAGADQRTPDIGPILQEIVSQKGWKKGNALAILIRGSGCRTGEAFDGEATSAPILHFKLAKEKVTGTQEAKTQKPSGATYTVNLHFAEPKSLEPGARVFDVQIQGKTVLKNFDIVQVAGGSRLAIIKEFSGISVNSDLTIRLIPVQGQPPILCGIEAIAE